MRLVIISVISTSDDFHHEHNIHALTCLVYGRDIFAAYDIAHRTHRSRDNQRELAVTVVVVYRFTEYESGSVAGFERKFALFVAFHYRVVHVAIRRVRLVPVDCVNPTKYRHACN